MDGRAPAVCDWRAGWPAVERGSPGTSAEGGAKKGGICARSRPPTSPIVHCRPDGWDKLGGGALGMASGGITVDQ